MWPRAWLTGGEAELAQGCFRVSGRLVAIHGDSTAHVRRQRLSVTTPAGLWEYALSCPASDLDDGSIRLDLSVTVGEVGVMLVDAAGRRLQEGRVSPGTSSITLGGADLAEAMRATALNAFDDFRARSPGGDGKPASIVVRNCNPTGPSQFTLKRISPGNDETPSLSLARELPVSRMAAGIEQASEDERNVIMDALGVLRRPEMAPSGAPTGSAAGCPYFMELHEVFVLDHLAKRANQGGRFCVVSVGAGYGEWLTSAWRLAPPGSSPFVVAVEADPRRVAWIKDHLDLNQVPPGARTIRHAVAGASGAVAFFPVEDDPAATFGASALDAEPDIGEVVPVAAIALADIVEDVGPVDLLQLDIQGAEIAALDDRFLATCAPLVRAICVSTHSARIHDALRSRLKAHGWSEVVASPIGTIFKVVFADGPVLWSFAVDGMIFAMSPVLRGPLGSDDSRICPDGKTEEGLGSS